MCLSIYLSVYPSICLSASLKTAWLLQSLTWATSKTQQFCETSSIFQVDSVDSIKNEAILWDFLQKWKVECRADGLVPIRFAIFPFHLSKVLRLPRKSEARPYEALHLSRKIILANKKIWCSKTQPFSGNQRLGLLTCTAPATRNASLQILYKWCPTPATFCSVQNPLLLPHKTTLQHPKVREHVVSLAFSPPNALFAP